MNSARDFSDSDNASLVSALRLFQGADADWTSEDLAAMCQHQLDAPLLEDIRQTLGKAAALEIAGALGDAPAATGIQSFRDALWCGATPPEVLRQVKNFAKISADHPDRPLPRPLARVLYYLAIVAAERNGHHISGLAPHELQTGLRWAVEQSWLDERCQSLLRSRLT